MKKFGRIIGQVLGWALAVPVAIFCVLHLFYILKGTATGLAAAAYIVIRIILKLWPYLLAAAAIVCAVLAVRGYIRKRKDEAAQKLDADYKEGFLSGARVGKEEGVTQGREDGLAQGREEGYSLGHSEGYKYALYTQNRFRYYNDDPPLTYAEARRSLDEGMDGANGELIEPPKKPRTRKKKAEPELIE